MHRIEFSQKLSSAVIYPATLPKSYSTTDTLPEILVILGTFTRNICAGVIFSTVTGGRLKSSR